MLLFLLFFLELSCFLNYPEDVGNLISGSSAFSKTSLNIWKFMVHILLKPGLENFEHYFTSVWDEYNCAVVWAFFGIAFLWDWNENWLFLVLYGQPQNQIDYVLCSQRWRSSIQLAKTRPGVDCGSIMNSLLPNSDLNWRKWGKPLHHSGLT